MSDYPRGYTNTSIGYSGRAPLGSEPAALQTPGVVLVNSATPSSAFGRPFSSARSRDRVASAVGEEAADGPRLLTASTLCSSSECAWRVETEDLIRDDLMAYAFMHGDSQEFIVKISRLTGTEFNKSMRSDEGAVGLGQDVFFALVLAEAWTWNDHTVDKSGGLAVQLIIIIVVGVWLCVVVSAIISKLCCCPHILARASE